MNDRVKQVRKALGLTQTEFGEKLGVTPSAILKIEKGQRGLTDQMERAICREFDVDTLWFHTGQGDMFVDHKSEIDNLIDVMMVDENETAKAVFKALARLGGQEWAVFDKLIREAAKELGVTNPNPEDVLDE